MIYTEKDPVETSPVTWTWGEFQGLLKTINEMRERIAKLEAKA